MRGLIEFASAQQGRERMTMDTAKRVIATVADKLGIARELIKPDSRFTADLGCDSLDDIELVMAMEDEFGLTIADDDAEKCVTVSDCIALVARLLPTPACAAFEA